jgi:hypothetical protein
MLTIQLKGHYAKTTHDLDFKAAYIFVFSAI